MRTAAWVRERAPSFSFATVNELLIVCGDRWTARAISVRFSPDAISSNNRRSNGVSGSCPAGRAIPARRSRHMRTLTVESLSVARHGGLFETLMGVAGRVLRIYYGSLSMPPPNSQLRRAESRKRLVAMQSPWPCRHGGLVRGRNPDRRELGSFRLALTIGGLSRCSSPSFPHLPGAFAGANDLEEWRGWMGIEPTQDASAAPRKRF